MRRVTLARAWSPTVDAHYRPGDTVEVPEDTAAWLEATGALVTGRTDPAPRAVPTTTVADTQTADPTPEKPVTTVAPGPEKPKRAASVEAWRAYAEAQGIDTKGLSKQEIIAAAR